MTKVMVAGFGWVSIVVVLDGYPKKAIGPYAGVPCTARPWLAALDMAVNHRFPEGARGPGVSLRREDGCHPRSLAFMEACRSREMHQAFPRDNNPRGQAETERFRRTLKEEGLGLRAWPCPFALSTALDRWSAPYTEQDLHSALGDTSPRQFERDCYKSPSPPFLAA